MNGRALVVAGNWKMNKSPGETIEMMLQLKPVVEKANCRVVLCVPFIDLEMAIMEAEDAFANQETGLNFAEIMRLYDAPRRKIEIGAQNCFYEEAGAFTGEISAKMLAELGVKLVILGHSERRQIFGEDNEMINKKVRAAIKAGLQPILCVGEALEQRESGQAQPVCEKQVREGLAQIPDDQISGLMIAYEPVWAIGTGQTATAAQANEMCGKIREFFGQIYGYERAEKLPVLYGGSMNAKNASELLQEEHIDGGLIGGASLKVEDFGAIIEIASQLQDDSN